MWSSPSLVIYALGGLLFVSKCQNYFSHSSICPLVVVIVIFLFSSILYVSI